jgi:uncharacterized protein YecE (DUF72 family)
MFEQATGDKANVEDEDFGVFREGVGPLLDARRLGVLLAQFPTSFRADSARLEYLADLVQRLRSDGFPLAIELRHREWTESEHGPALRKLMEEHKVAWVMIDEPRFKTSIRHVPLTTDLGYFRFHGRNYQNWWRHGESEDRYNYLYTPQEQKELAEDVREVATSTRDTYAFYNNHFGAKAVVNAVQLQDLLGMPRPQQPLPEPLLQAFPDVLGAAANP